MSADNDGASRKLVIALSASLALNLFLVGFLSAGPLGRSFGPDHRDHHRPAPAQLERAEGRDAGEGAERGPRGERAHRPRGRGPGGHPLGMLRAARRLELDTDAQGLLRARRQAMRAHGQALRQTRARVEAALAAEPFDAAALQQAFEAQRAAHQAAQGAAHAAMVELATRLPAAQRKQLVERRR